MNSEQDSADAMIELIATALLKPLKNELVRRFETDEYAVDSYIKKS